MLRNEAIFGRQWLFLAVFFQFSLIASLGIGGEPTNRGSHTLVVERVKPCGSLFLSPEEGIDAFRTYRRDGTPIGVSLLGQVEYLGGTISADSDGNFLISEWNQDRVKVISRSGALIRTISGGGLDGPHGACLTPTGEIAVCSYLTDSIKFYSATGTYLSNLAHSLGTQDPQGVAYDRDGFLYVACRNNGNGHVGVFNAARQFVMYIGQGQFGQHALDLAFDVNENLYVTSPVGVKKFSKTGTLLGTLTNTGLDPKGIAIDDTGRIWVSDHAARRIMRFDAAGGYLDTLPISLGSSPASSLRLYGLAFDTLPDADCNANSTPDACDVEEGTSLDCNLNAVPDECELAGHDCDNNQVPDGCQPDCDSDGIPNVCEIAACPQGNLSCQDCNSNGIPDGCELRAGPTNPPPDGIPSPVNGHYYLVTPTSTNWAACEAYAVTRGGHLATIRNSTENEWIRATFAPSIPGYAWIGINDISIEGTFVWTSGEPVTYSNWYPGEPNNLSNEDNGEMILSSGLWNDWNGSHFGIVEVILGNDCNQNGRLDSCDIAAGNSLDCNGNALPDECEFGGTVDCNNNGIVDLCEPGGAADCNRNSVSDFCDIANCPNGDLSCADCNANGVPDGCEIQDPFSLNFDGQNDHVRIPRSADFEPKQEMTFEAWVRPDSVGSYSPMVCRFSADFGAGYIIAWQWQNGGRLQIRIDGSQQGSQILQDTTPVSSYVGQWHHVSFTYSTSANQAKLYVDGVLKVSSGALGLLNYSNSDLFIGNSIIGSSDDFDGRIDEVRIWNIARTAQQINDDKNRSLSGNESGLVAYWRFDEGSGQTVFDSSPFGNHGYRGANSNPAGDASDPEWSPLAAQIPTYDCNSNNIPDDCDIADKTSVDCDSNGVPDECQQFTDCNNNSTADYCDIAGGASIDCNANGVPDECEAGGTNDCNQNSISDLCDIFTGTSTDCDVNNVPDDCQPDFDQDTVIDACDNCRYNPNIKQVDTDNDGVGNVCDNCPTNSNTNQLDTDHDGRGDVCDNCPLVPNGSSQTDSDGDGVGNACDQCPGFNDHADADGDCKPDACDLCPTRATGDVNGDGSVNGRDIESFVDVLLNGTVQFLKLCAADVDGDLEVDLSDVPPFAQLLTKGTCQ